MIVFYLLTFFSCTCRRFGFVSDDDNTFKVACYVNEVGSIDTQVLLMVVFWHFS